MRYAKENQVSNKKDELQKQIEETERKVKKLKEQNLRLKDEVKSLWGMLDELQEADIKNWSHLMKELEKKHAVEQLMSTTKKADC
jgi:peptidoglycan hydrolase CwlO-like protein